MEQAKEKDDEEIRGKSRHTIKERKEREGGDMIEVGQGENDTLTGREKKGGGGEE